MMPMGLYCTGVVLIMFMKMSDNTFSSSITNLSSIQFSPFFNNLWGRQNSLCWQCMVYYRNLWNLSIGNKWPIYMHTALVIMHGRPDVKLVGSRGVTIHRCIGESYRNCQRYANRIVSGWIDSHDISSGGRNQAIKCPLKSENLPNSTNKMSDKCYRMKFDLFDDQLLLKRHHTAQFNRWAKMGVVAIMSEMLL